jgi:23S rRNA U2552 (ribose-2'-O)-methylase RlmE/FtsJ
METTIFKKGEVKIDFFKGVKLYEYKKYKSLSELKNKVYGNYVQLDSTKAKIDVLDNNLERSRRSVAKYFHKYELLKVISKKKVISRAYFKMYELIYNNDILNNDINCFFICEAPGGFIEAITDISNRRGRSLQYSSISKEDDDLKYNKNLHNSCLMYGDITNVNTLKTLTKQKKCNVITADGGFDIKNFNSQEIISGKLLLCEIYLALSLQEKGGTFIIKFFDMFTHNSMMYYLILCSFYKYVKIIKPETSRDSNSERYLVCEYFEELNQDKQAFIESLLIAIEKFISIEINNNGLMGIHTVLFPKFNFNLIESHWLIKLQQFNNIIINTQIKVIEESLSIIKKNKFYIENLIINIFMEKVTLEMLKKYKNILMSRITHCVNWLNYHEIPIKFNL